MAETSIQKELKMNDLNFTKLVVNCEKNFFIE